jgi:hypothetical protein
MHEIILLSVKYVKRRLRISRTFSQATLPVLHYPSETGRSGPVEYRGCDLPSECDCACGSESKIQGLASVLRAALNQSVQGNFRWYRTSMGHLLFRYSCFQSLTSEQRLR